MSGAIPLLPYMPSWLAHGKHYFYLSQSNIIEDELRLDRIEHAKQHTVTNKVC